MTTTDVPDLEHVEQTIFKPKPALKIVVRKAKTVLYEAVVLSPLVVLPLTEEQQKTERPLWHYDCR